MESSKQIDCTNAILKASNLEMAMLEYFSTPSMEEYHALAILNSRLRSDREIAQMKLDRAKGAVCETQNLIS